MAIRGAGSFLPFGAPPSPREAMVSVALQGAKKELRLQLLWSIALRISASC